VLIERERLGGDCTWTGCVPSKALIERAREVHSARRRGADFPVNFAGIMKEIRAAVETIAGDEDRPTLEREGITVAQGQASFVAPRRISVDGTVLAAAHVVIATGAAPVVPPIEGLREAQPLTSDTVFDLDRPPTRLAVMGGGPIGVELAQAFARLGTAVTVLDGADRLVGKEEPEAATVMQEVFTREGIDLLLGSFVDVVEHGGDGTVTLRTTDGREVTSEQILCAVGRRPVTDGLDLDRGGVKTDDKGFIKTDERLRTSEPHTYAVGDITGELQFTHAGDEMGRIAITNALGRLPVRRWDPRAVPWATFTDPEIGRVGMTEEQAHDRYRGDARVAYLPLADTDRGRATGHTDGFVKLIARPRRLLRDLGGGQLLGATVMSPAGAEVVQEAVFAMRTRAFTGRLAQTVHPYPSWGLAMRETAAQFFGEHRGRKARSARPAEEAEHMNALQRLADIR
jgi:pyruvate/2-oxoglutarate dehydrogenase complex dihydrolipoamide dehydrogenase (E3) component